MKLGGVQGAKQKNALNCRIRGVPSFTLPLWLCKRLLVYTCASPGNSHITVAFENTASHKINLFFMGFLFITLTTFSIR